MIIWGCSFEAMPSYINMSEIIVKDKQEKKNIGGHKPFGVDLDPNKDQQDLFNDICDSAICGV